MNPVNKPGATPMLLAGRTLIVLGVVAGVIQALDFLNVVDSDFDHFGTAALLLILLGYAVLDRGRAVPGADVERSNRDPRR